MNRQKHYIQDAGEKYFIYAVSSELKRIGKLHTESLINIARKNFISYAKDRSCTDAFNASEYKKIYDTAAPLYVRDLREKFGESSKFNIIDVEKDARNSGKKADFRVEVYAKNTVIATIEQSLKAYESSSNIQVCSGTFLSTVLSVLFDKKGVGKFVNPKTGESFSSANISKLEEALDCLGEETKKNTLVLRNIQKEVEVWKTDPTKMLWKDITYTDAQGATHTNKDDAAWKAFCDDIGCKGRNAIAKVMKSVSQNKLKRFFGKVMGITGEEEILILAGDGTYINSICNIRAKKLVEIFQNQNSKVAVVIDGKNKGITLQLISEDNTVVLEAYIPTTINRNGMWQLDEIDGRVLTKKRYSGTFVAYGERRPDKLEIATSTNCWIDIRKYL